MVYDMLNELENALVTQFGSLTIVALIVIAFFIIAFLIARIDFRFVILLISLLVLGLSRAGWIPSWVEGAFWIIGIGLGLYIAWTYLQR